MIRPYLVPVFLCAVFLVPVGAQAALVNINTADVSALETLPGIGPSKAAAIVTYRSEKGLFAKIADIQKVSGIGPSTYANIASLITVVGPAPETSGNREADKAASTSSPTKETASAAAYIAPPSVLKVSIGGSDAVFADMPASFSASVTDAKGTKDAQARILWSFGDGSSAEGTRVEKTYRYAGSYAIVATAYDGETEAQAERTVVVAVPSVRIVSVTQEGVTIVNDAPTSLDLSAWRLTEGTGSFRFPKGATVLASSSVLFPSAVTDLPVSFDAALWYPDGARAAQYIPPAPVEDLAADVVSGPFPTAETPPRASEAARAAAASVPSVPLPKKSTAEHPVPTTPASSSAPAAEAPKASLHGILHSRWLIGALGVVAVAGGALLIL